MRTWLVWVLTRCLRLLRWLVRHFTRPAHPQWRSSAQPTPFRRVFAQPKPTWVRNEVIRLKAVMPQAGCRTIAHHFNRRWASRRHMTVGKSYVACMLRRQQHLILEARRKLKHRVPRLLPPNQIWGCDLMVKTDRQGRAHLILGLLDHASRACLRLHQLPDKCSWRLLQGLIQAIDQYGRPRSLRTDNEAVFLSRRFRLGLWALGIRHQRIEPGCPWQNGRIERFFGTVKRTLSQEPASTGEDLDTALATVRQWYNHERPHDHLRGRTPAEAWAGIDVFTARSG